MSMRFYLFPFCPVKQLVKKKIREMFFARFVVCVLLVAFFAAVILSATTTGSGEYSAAVSAGTNYCGEAHNTKCFYSVKEQRWFMKSNKALDEEARGDDDLKGDAASRDAGISGSDSPVSGPQGPSVDGPHLPDSSGHGTTLGSSQPADETLGKPGSSGGGGPGGNKGGPAASPSPDLPKNGPSGSESPGGAERPAEKNGQGSGPASTSGAPENSQKSGAAGNGGGNSGSGSTEAPEKKDDPQKAKGDKQSSTTPQPPTTAPSSREKNIATSSTVSETKSDVANIGITAPLRGLFGFLFLFLLPLIGLPCAEEDRKTFCIHRA